MEIGRVGPIVQRCQRQLVSLDHLAVAEPFEHKFVGKDALIVNFEPVFVELKFH